MAKSNRKPQIIEKSFLAEQIVLYHFCATIWFVGSLAALLVLTKGDYVKLVPNFLEPLLIKHDWLTILYFPLLAALFVFFTVFGCQRYKWYCRRIKYKIENGEIFIKHGEIYSRINAKELIQINCRIIRSIFPFTGRVSPLYRYYVLVIELPNRKYSFCSTPFGQYEEPEDFMQFIGFLKRSGLSVKMKETAYYKYRIWKLKIDQKQNHTKNKDDG